MRRTPLTDAHRAAGARLIDFHGWEMPVQYAGIIDEVRRVRSAVGLFDLCHMGRLVLRGPDRERLLDRVFSASTARLRHGRAKYGFLLDERGYPIDDVLVYRDTEAVHVVINAGGRDEDPTWVERHQREGGFDADVEDVSDGQAMLALQGPASEMTLQVLCGADLSALRYYGFTHAPVDGIPCLIARTGYTGEDGFELFFDAEYAGRLWDALLAAGRSTDIAPIGLGARDTLRLEAGMPLYGQEISREIHPLEADLAFGVDLSKTETIGIPALAAIAEAGLARRAVSLEGVDRRVARTGCLLYRGDDEVGVVTSGSFSPTLDRTIARGLVAADAAVEGARLDAEIRGKRHPLTVVPSPFYKRAR